MGEPYTIGPDEGILALLESVKPWFVGQDPSRIEWLLRRARNSMRFPQGPVGWSALSGIDHALWDIAGKAAGLPVLPAWLEHFMSRRLESLLLTESVFFHRLKWFCGSRWVVVVSSMAR